MLKCKCCKKSDLGVNLIKITKDPVRLLNGEITAVLGAQEVTEEIEYCFCNTCKKPITKDDLYEHVECPVCNRQVNELVNGKCVDCDKISSEMESFSKDDLIRILIKLQMQIEGISDKKKEAPVVKKEVVKPKKETNDISKIKLEEDDDILSKIENLEIEGLNFDDDDIEIDD